MADRFAAGGRLIAIGVSPAARSDVRHVAVEFVHPVIVGKRALPALGITSDAGDPVRHLATLALPHDIVFAFGVNGGDECAPLAAVVAAARARGCLTIATDRAGADFDFCSPSPQDDPFVWQELVETLYHVLWELVHVFLEHVTARPPRSAVDIGPGASAFLYPFLTDRPRDLAALAGDVSRSVVTKADETDTLRTRTLTDDGGDAIRAAAHAIRQRLESGGTVLAFGNGGSATDATDLVADLRAPPAATALSPRRALDLCEDEAILTALMNDVGPDVVFARQIIAYGGPSDVAVGFSTSGSSRNLVTALEQARRRQMLTVAFTGYDGGRIAAEELADHVIVVPSQYIPRIQEAHATAYHIMRLLIG